MVTSIQGNQARYGMEGFAPPAALSDEQTAKVTDILGQYDAAKVTAADAKNIFQAFREAGIRPGPGMRETIEAAGFDAEQLRELGRPEEGRRPAAGRRGGPGGPGQMGQAGLNVSALQSLQTILSNFDLNSLGSDQEQQTSLISQLQAAGLMQSGNMIDLNA